MGRLNPRITHAELPTTNNRKNNKTAAEVAVETPRNITHSTMEY